MQHQQQIHRSMDKWLSKRFMRELVIGLLMMRDDNTDLIDDNQD